MVKFMRSKSIQETIKQGQQFIKRNRRKSERIHQRRQNNKLTVKKQILLKNLTTTPTFSDLSIYIHKNILVDVVFCCQATKTMNPFIRQIIRVMKNIIASFKNKNFNFKFGFTAYRDHPPQDFSFVTTTCNLDERTVISKFIKSIQTTRPGDYPQAVLDGLYEAASSIQWRSKLGCISQRYIIHLANCPPHGSKFTSYPSIWGQGCPYSPSIEQVSRKLEEQSIKYRMIKIKKQLKKMCNIFSTSIKDYNQLLIQKAQQVNQCLLETLKIQLLTK